MALARDQGRLLHPYFLARMLFTPEQSNSLSTVRDSKAIERSLVSLEENLAHTRDLDPVNRVSYLESRCYMLNTLLRDSDVMSMAHGLEVRVPLIDHHLVEELFALPGNWKLDSHTPKPLLVAALCGDLPDQIVHRRKRGFTLPFEHWLRADLHSGVDTTLRKVADGPLASVLDASAILKIWQDFRQGRTSWSRPWALYVLQRLVRIALSNCLNSRSKMHSPFKVRCGNRSHPRCRFSQSSSREVPLPISVIVPVRNEARNLPRCLESLRGIGEVYVIDSHSTDDTSAIALSYGAKVVQFDYAGGWPKKRQWAMDTLPLVHHLDFASRCRRNSHP